MRYLVQIAMFGDGESFGFDQYDSHTDSIPDLIAMREELRKDVKVVIGVWRIGDGHITHVDILDEIGGLG